VVRELIVVIPVFNEEQCVESVLRDWTAALDRSGIDYGLLVLNDGSTDSTLDVIQKHLAGHGAGRVEVISHANRGHGQTCLAGYRIACQRGIPWVVQIDSDGQCDPAYFPTVWAKRNEHDVVYGHRAERRDGWKRVLASALVKIVVKVSSGADCIDANVPYRLMRTQNLRPLVNSIPSNFNLANIALSVQLKRAGWRECSVNIVFRPRTGGESSVPLSRFAVKALELYRQLSCLPDPAAS
jgi:glycosyltransferase involved in cell wall biosynthesis